MTGHSLETAREAAALYTVGAMPPEERQEFEAHLAGGCELCRTEVEAFAAVGGALAEASPTISPRPALRAAVLDAVARHAGAEAVTVKDGVRFVRSTLLGWEPGAVGRVQVKRLHHDSKRGYQSVLIRMLPGDRYPSHRHAEAEEVYVIEGDLTLNGVTMLAGDYCRAEAGSSHSEVTSRTGCTFIVFASDRDELLD
jgi:anti-sigma factor ChrR (cupin superfamily)